MTQELTEQAPESLDELGPVDWIVVEFPGSRFRGEIAPILDDLVDRGTVRVLDLLLIRKDEDGELEFFELSDLDESEMGSLRAYETELAIAAQRGRRERGRGSDGAGQHRGAAGLGEPVGRAVRVGRAPRRRSAGGQRADPGPGVAGRGRGGRTTTPTNRQEGE